MHVFIKNVVVVVVVVVLKEIKMLKGGNSLLFCISTTDL